MGRPLTDPCFIVDDDPDLRRLIAHTVHRAGLQTVECSGLGDMVRALRQERPALVFLDAGLADATASEILEVLAENQCNAYVRMVSGRGADDLDRIVEDGEDFGLRMLPPLGKPFQSAEIRETVERYVVGAEAAR